jgi:site-specific recombinase XerD
LEIVTAQEVGALLDAVPQRTPTGARNAALILLIYRAGLRLQETLELRPVEVDLDEGTARIRGRSTTSTRVVGLDARTITAIRRWLEMRDALEIDPGAPLLCTLQGERIKDAYVRALFARLAERSGIAKRVHASGLRAAHALELDAEGFPIGMLRDHLGMESVAETQQYLDRHRPVDRVRAIQSRQWRG